jgi:ADP-heptose:LPS heptosyltransferase
MHRVVIFRPGALGDALLTFPALALVRRAWPDAHLTLVARRDILPVARSSGLINAVYSYDLPVWTSLFADGAGRRIGTSPPAPPLTGKGRPHEDRLRGLASETAEEDAPAMQPFPRLGASAPEPCVGTSVLQMPRLPRGDDLLTATLDGAAVVAWLSDPEGVFVRNAWALGAEHVVATGAQSDGPPGQTHVALALARSLAPLGLAAPADVAALRAMLPPLAPPEDDARRADDAWRGLTLPEDAVSVVALHPGSGGATKRWPPGSFASLADTIRGWDMAPLLIEGPQDGAVTAAVQAAGGPRTLPVARDLSVGALAALLARCSGYVGNDSGVTHLAGMVGVPTLALFGPTDPVRWAPLGPRVRIVRAPGVALDALEVAEVAEVAEALLHAP